MNRHSAIRALLASLFLAAALGTQGCALVVAGAAGAGTVAFVRGQLDATLAKPYERVASAAEGAVDRLHLAKISEARDALSTVIVARTAEDQKVRLTISREADGLAVVHIRIGLFGDEVKSRAILEKIQDGL